MADLFQTPDDPMRGLRRVGAFGAAAAFAAVMSGAAPASAQGVDRYQFLQLERQVEEMAVEVERMRNSLRGADLNRRLNALEDEISRLTGQIERLEFAQRSHIDESKRRMDDLEYRIIELEGGDPSILFENDEDDGDSSLLAPAAPAPAGGGAPSGGTLGVITTTAPVGPEEKSAFDSAVASIEAGRPDGAAAMRAFIDGRPDSPLAGDAHFWLGEAHFREGAYQAAANAYLDAVTLHPAAPKSPQSLLRLGVSLSLLGQNDVACSTLREVAQRYPSASDVIAQAEAEAQRSGCG